MSGQDDVKDSSSSSIHPQKEREDLLRVSGDSILVKGYYSSRLLEVP